MPTLREYMTMWEMRERAATVIRRASRGELFGTDTTVFITSDAVFVRTERRLVRVLSSELEVTLDLIAFGFLIMAGGPGQTLPTEDGEVTVWQFVPTTTGLALLDRHQS
ncbi:hypothetical protein L6E12_26085 [Actinokineospora sp. PR83]|uniref:hypothetical protein n=1 Tax=Actinokineospora sp. PR83 TaxID=2884908 RepID=UPI001F2BC6D3|nr:hypothetical protein [Actinokineospora sp. PR83]MCG8919249.1 hypothetical protein [Actinokineospora sp. PR83]